MKNNKESFKKNKDAKLSLTKNAYFTTRSFTEKTFVNKSFGKKSFTAKSL